MVLGALADIGADLNAIAERLAAALPFEFELRPERVVRRGIAGTFANVYVHEHHAPHRGLHDLLHILEGADLPAKVKASSEKAFRTLADAEAAVHGTSPEKIHFHEVGAGDTLIDIIGANLAFRGVFDVGGIGTNVWFPNAEANGMDLGLIFGFAVGKGFEIRVGGDFRRYWFDLNPEPPDPPYVAGGALDRYLGATIGVAWRR